MGQTCQARCLDCDESFMADQGDGFFIHLVRCEHCGESKRIAFEELGELHLRYLKTLPNGRCVLGGNREARVRVHVPVEPISAAEYHAGVQAIAGACGCGGRFTLDAPPRCPLCRSTRIILA